MSTVELYRIVSPELPSWRGRDGRAPPDDGWDEMRRRIDKSLVFAQVWEAYSYGRKRIAYGEECAFINTYIYIYIYVWVWVWVGGCEGGQTCKLAS